MMYVQPYNSQPKKILGESRYKDSFAVKMTYCNRFL